MADHRTDDELVLDSSENLSSDKVRLACGDFMFLRRLIERRY